MTELGYILKGDIIKELDSFTIDELTGGKKAIGSSPAVAGSDSFWKRNVKGAVDYMLGFTRHWYDMDTEVRSIKDFDNAYAYAVGDRVADTVDADGFQNIYVCTVISTGNLLTDDNFFSAGDDRNNVLVEIVVLIISYNLSRRKNPRQVPEQRLIDKEQAIKDLRMIQKGEIMLDIALRADVYDDDPGYEQAYGDFDDVTQDSY